MSNHGDLYDELIERECLALAESMLRNSERIMAETLANPWHHVRVISVHPDRYDEMVEKCAVVPPLPAPFGAISGIEILRSPLIAKDRALLQDGLRRLIGVCDLTTGACSMFRPQETPVMPKMEFPKWPDRENEPYSFMYWPGWALGVVDRYAMAIPSHCGCLHYDSGTLDYVAPLSAAELQALRLHRRRERKHAEKVARRARIRADNARRKVRR